MFEIKWEGHFERNEEDIKNALSDIMEKAVLQNGCSDCQGKNLTIYVNAINRNSVEGYSYCHDCKKKGNVHVEHDIYDQLDKVERQFKDILRGVK